MMTKTLSPHEHKLFTESLTRVRLRIREFEMLHFELENDFAALYELTGDETFRRAFDTLYSVQHPILHQGLPQ
jgi:hypothetical protein